MSLYNLILQCLSVVCFFFSPKAFLSRKLCVASHTSRFAFTAFQYAYLTIKWFPSDCFEADKCAHAASLYVVISLFFHWRKRLNINKSANIWKTKKKLFSVTLKSLDKGKMQRHSLVSVICQHSLKLKQHWFIMGLRVLYTTGDKFTAGQGSCMHQQRLASGPWGLPWNWVWMLTWFYAEPLISYNSWENCIIFLKKILYSSQISVLSEMFMPVRFFFDIICLSSESMWLSFCLSASLEAQLKN